MTPFSWPGFASQQQDRLVQLGLRAASLSRDSRAATARVVEGASSASS